MAARPDRICGPTSSGERIVKKVAVLLVTALALFALVGVSACAGSGGTSKTPVVVASKIDTEGSLLSQVIILMLRANGIDAVDKSQFGTTQIVRKALLSGEIDVYPEYTGNGEFFFEGTDPTVWKDAQKGYELVKKLDGEKNNVVWLKPAPANNTWAIAVPKALADKENLKTLTDFAAYANKGGYVKLIGSEEFVTSPPALPSFQKAYGFTLKQEQLVTLSSGNTAQTEKAAAEGTGGVNAAMAYGTDGALAALNLVVLGDPMGVQPVYEPAPLVRKAVLDKNPKMAGILDPVFQSLDLQTLQTLNGRIAFEGKNATDVARDYLKSKGFLK